MQSHVGNQRESRHLKLLDFFEGSIERVIEGSFGRLLPGKLQPAEIARRIERELVVQQVIGIDGPIAPNSFRVVLNPADAVPFDGYQDHLASELAEWIEGLCDERGLSTVGPISVSIERDNRVPRRTVRIAAAMLAGPDDQVPMLEDVVETVSYTLEIGWNRGGSQRFHLRDGFTIVGRAPASDVVIDDPSVSRYHARIELSGRRLDIRDLDSTNGTRINGRWVGAAPLETGDHVRFGSVEARITSEPGSRGR